MKKSSKRKASRKSKMSYSKRVASSNRQHKKLEDRAVNANRYSSNPMSKTFDMNQKRQQYHRTVRIYQSNRSKLLSKTEKKSIWKRS